LYDEQATFEARPVLEPRRARLGRFMLAVPVIAFIAVAGAGLSGARHDRSTADNLVPPAIAVVPPAPSAAQPRPTDAARPDLALGLAVQRLDEVQREGLGPDDVFAVVGWYVPTGMSDCPPLAAKFKASTSPATPGFGDAWAYCTRTGVLYASPPAAPDSWSGSAGLGAVGVSVATGVVMPSELELVGGDAIEVVVVAQFLDSGSCLRCAAPGPPLLLVDHVAWSSGA
jgi:hypothetical protein